MEYDKAIIYANIDKDKTHTITQPHPHQCRIIVCPSWLLEFIDKKTSKLLIHNKCGFLEFLLVSI